MTLYYSTRNFSETFPLSGNKNSLGLPIVTPTTDIALIGLIKRYLLSVELFQYFRADQSIHIYIYASFFDIPILEGDLTFAQ